MAGRVLVTGVSGFIEEYVYLVEVGRENERLIYESARLKQRVRDLEELEDTD